jgi:long-chain fatty acid transport protein
VTILMLPSSGWATNGYFQHGIGVKEQSIGGAATAFPQSAMSAATNPATIAAIDNRLDLGLDWFTPSHYADNGDGSGYHGSGSDNFLIPQFGSKYQLNDDLSIGLIVYANGGMQTDWDNNFFGSTPTYSNLTQLVIAPTLAYRVTPQHSLGLSINYIRQTFEARGLQNVAPSTPSGTTNYLTDQGEDEINGWGVRLGYFGELSERLNIGVFWQPETEMGRFSKYRELLPEQGSFNVPETYGIGLGIKLRDDLQLAADLITIKYSDVPTLGNRNNIGSVQLGDDKGPGFGWRDVNVIKLGLVYQHTPTLTLRAGWNHGDNPIRSSDTAFNILSPATITDHFTCGLSWKFRKHSEVSMTYWHGFNNESKGNFSAANGADAANLKMEQNNIGLAYSWRF